MHLHSGRIFLILQRNFYFLHIFPGVEIAAVLQAILPEILCTEQFEKKGNECEITFRMESALVHIDINTFCAILLIHRICLTASGGSSIGIHNCILEKFL